MITLNQFEDAKKQKEKCEKIIKTYWKEQREMQEQKQQEREDNCPGHEYEYTNAKWRPESQRRCINCGKVIE